MKLDALFWQRMHGGSTHFPIVLLLASLMFDLTAWRSRDEGSRRGLHAAGLGSAVVGVLGGVGAIISGLVMSRGRVLGMGYERLHHLFVWPAFSLCLVLVVWRLWQRGRMAQPALGIYLAGMGVASALMMGAGYWGGEMLLGVETQKVSAPATAPSAQLDPPVLVAKGHQLYLANCAHCHAQDATGDEGPDLHGLMKTDGRLAAMINNGIRGEMPKFSSKLSEGDVQALIAFLHSLD